MRARNMKCLFVVPARGGSKGVPGKNLATIAGIPLVARAVRTARRTAADLPFETRVVCSTDDPKIAAVAREWGAEVPILRPPELATDSTPSLLVVHHVLETLGWDPEVVILLQPTSPFTDPSDVRAAIELHSLNGQPVVGVCESEHPVEWQFELLADGRLRIPGSGTGPSRRQDCKRTYRANGALFVASPRQVQQDKGFWSTETHAFVMPRERSVDIDTWEDLALARGLSAERSVRELTVGKRRIGSDSACFVVAEAGVNHNGSLERALELVDVAAKAGADAVKFQLYRAEEQVSATTPTAEYQRIQTASLTMLEMAKRYDLPWEAHRAIRDRCRAKEILYLASCFDALAVDFYIDELGGEAVKVGSGELTNHALLAHMARRGKPILLSTGMSSLSEVAAALDRIESVADVEVGLFHCVSNYPAAPRTLNLQSIRTLREAFGRPTGFSDHSEGERAAVTAIGLGANLIEKHFTTDRTLPGPDHSMSLDPRALAAYVLAIREAEASLGSGRKEMQPEEQHVRNVARRSLVAAREISRGEILTTEHLTAKRPGTGIDPSKLETVLGKRAAVDVEKGSLITWTMLV